MTATERSIRFIDAIEDMSPAEIDAELARLAFDDNPILATAARLAQALHRECAE